MKIAIYDVDSKIPNLALMKLSAWHKANGDHVEHYLPLLRDNYDKIYASKIFNFSDDSMLSEDKMIIGGTGWDMKKTLPDEIENMTPDYSIYNYPHNIGFTMRGCRLRCSFCVVPEKEGKPYGVSTIEEIWSQRSSKHIVLLDNDFFGNPDWKERIEEIKEHDLQVNFSQGLNIRNIKAEQAAAVASVRFSNMSGKAKQVHFAWDDPRHEKLIHKGIQTCIEAGIKPYQMAFYVLIGYHSTPEEDMHRVETLRS
ncbi:MAG: radical SAM protein, partial [Pelagibacteraceae bacterium]